MIPELTDGQKFFLERFQFFTCLDRQSWFNHAIQQSAIHRRTPLVEEMRHEDLVFWNETLDDWLTARTPKPTGVRTYRL